MDITAVDMFCGIGGLTHGLIREGMKVVAGFDIDPTCRYAYEHNNNARFFLKRIEDLKPDDISNLYPYGSVKILVGCAPCQPFSTYTKKATDEKWKLLETFADLICRVQPDVVSMENVPALRTFRSGTVYREFVGRLTPRYSVTDYIVHCPSFGIPQKRRRLVLFASKYGPLKLTTPTHAPIAYKTVRDTIQHLPSLRAGASDRDDPLHRASRLSDINLRRIRESRCGGTWRDWSEDLIAACHSKTTGQKSPSVYGRMSWDQPAPTITTESFGYGSGRFGHPDQDRAISLREAALLQTFPPDYCFVEPEAKWHITTIGRHIGNAVPVALGQVIGRSITEHLKGYNVDQN